MKLKRAGPIGAAAAAAALLLSAGAADACHFAIDCTKVYVGGLTENFATGATVTLTDLDTGNHTSLGVQPVDVTVGYPIPESFGDHVLVKVESVPSTEHGAESLTRPANCTEATTTTTPQDTTTTAAATTTTAAATTTSQGATTTSGATTTTAATTTTTHHTSSTPPPTPPPTMPVTGGFNGGAAVLGVGTLGLGVLALGAARRRAHAGS